MSDPTPSKSRWWKRSAQSSAQPALTPAAPAIPAPAALASAPAPVLSLSSIEAPVRSNRQGERRLNGTDERRLYDPNGNWAGRKKITHDRVLDLLSGRPINTTRQEKEALVLQVFNEEATRGGWQLRRTGEREALITALMDDIFGLGVIQKLVDDPSISEVMVNGVDEIYIERNGRVIKTNLAFDSTERMMAIIERIVSRVGRRVDESFPMVDARLPDGSRVNIILPPLSLKGPCVTIRKFRAEHFTAEQLLEMSSASEPMITFLRAAVRGRENILVTGGTSSGKTTLLNTLSSFINDNERIVTIEDAAELRLEQEHVLSLETRTENSDRKGAIVIRDLVRNALRMRPDRIVVGEVRGPEALDMIQAMNTGHDGSMSTLHANSPEDGIERLVTMSMMAGTDVPVDSIRFQIAGAIGLVVHAARVAGGARKIINVSEVYKDKARGMPRTRSIFIFRQTGTDESGDAVGTYLATGVKPRCLFRIRERGVELSDDVFNTSSNLQVRAPRTRRAAGELAASRRRTNRVPTRSSPTTQPAATLPPVLEPTVAIDEPLASEVEAIQAPDAEPVTATVEPLVAPLASEVEATPLWAPSPSPILVAEPPVWSPPAISEPEVSA